MFEGIQHIRSDYTRSRKVYAASSVGGVVTGPAATQSRTLTVADRCDRCGAQAYVHVVLPGGGDLMFCRHHAQAYSAKLSEVATEIRDESEKLDLSPDRG